MTSQTITTYQEANAAQPVVAFRCPTPEHLDALRTAAAASGLSVSGYLRRIIAENMKEMPHA